MMRSLLLVLLSFVFSFCNGSHFRGSYVSWKLGLQNGTSYQVEFTVQIAWRVVSQTRLYLGDGSSIDLYSSECSAGVAPCVAQDTSSGVYYETVSTDSNWRLIRYIFDYTYQWDSSSTYTVYFESCCRVGNQNPSGSSFRVETDVVFANSNTGSPVASIPPLLTFTLGASNTFNLLPVDNDGESVTCRLATEAESRLSGQTHFTVDSQACTMSISETGSVGYLWASHVIMETGNGDRSGIDFMFYGTDSVNSQPACSFITALPASGTFEVDAGDTLNVQLQATDSDDTDLTVSVNNIPSGATVTPTGSGNTVPVTIDFQWTPSSTQLGGYSASISVTDDSTASGLCNIPIFVNDPATDEPTPAPTDNPTPYPTDRPTSTPTPAPTSDPTDNPTPAPTSDPTNMPTPSPLWVSPCATDPCDCNDDSVDPHCAICHSNGCDQCEQVGTYFKKDYNYPCVHCQEVFGDECLHCQDFNGCAQCETGYFRTLDFSEDLYYCEECDYAFGDGCQWCEDGNGCTYCASGYTRTLSTNDNKYYCVENEPTPQPTLQPSDSTVPGCPLQYDLCTHSGCYQEDPNCVNSQTWGCVECASGYWKKAHNIPCIACSDIDNCDSCENWNGCKQEDGCASGYQSFWDNDCGFRRCQ